MNIPDWKLMKILEVRVSLPSSSLDLQTYQGLINIVVFLHILWSLLCSTTQGFWVDHSKSEYLRILESSNTLCCGLWGLNQTRFTLVIRVSFLIVRLYFLIFLLVILFWNLCIHLFISFPNNQVPIIGYKESLPKMQACNFSFFATQSSYTCKKRQKHIFIFTIMTFLSLLPTPYHFLTCIPSLKEMTKIWLKCWTFAILSQYIEYENIFIKYH